MTDYKEWREDLRELLDSEGKKEHKRLLGYCQNSEDVVPGSCLTDLIDLSRKALTELEAKETTIARLRENAREEARANPHLMLGRIANCLSEPLECGHPLDCWDEPEGSQRCAWCHEVSSFRAELEAKEAELAERRTAAIDARRELGDLHAENIATQEALAEAKAENERLCKTQNAIRQACDGRVHVDGPAGIIREYFMALDELPEEFDVDDLYLPDALRQLGRQLEKLADGKEYIETELVEARAEIERLRDLHDKEREKAGSAIFKGSK